ncbi:hypothetical protein QYE76_063778 [Lolium multiflorum]|uniref:Retrotransposon gag domain-containing protein n=1 Tax=Lolium multiflorum TaxID=4521 RepID=A0AAD8S755_LOLMU|nr:hypothetical protein QYE76_063778 [Lolium multiflorum]
MTRHQHWIATQAVNKSIHDLTARIDETVARYEERAQVQRRDLNVQVQDIHDKLDAQAHDMRATLATQGQQNMASMRRQEERMARLEQAIANIANNRSQHSRSSRSHSSRHRASSPSYHASNEDPHHHNVDAQVLQQQARDVEQARNEDEDGARPPPRRNDRNEEEIFGKLKFTMPKFHGEEDPDAYLSWVLKVDKIFRIHNFSEAKKVAMASLEFEGYENVWWEEVNKKRDKEDLEHIDTWEEMQEVMHKRFVPNHHKRDLFNKLTQLKQSFKSVEEYYKEMHDTSPTYR